MPTEGTYYDKSPKLAGMKPNGLATQTMPLAGSIGGGFVLDVL